MAHSKPVTKPKKPRNSRGKKLQGKCTQRSHTLLSSLTNRKKLLETLEKAGFTTLEQCARDGTDRIRLLRGAGMQTVVALRKHAYRLKIDWIKTPDEERQYAKEIQRLINEYDLHPTDAAMIARFCFTEGCRPIRPTF